MLIGYYNIANMVTLGGLCAALASCYVAFATGDFKLAILIYMFAGLADMVDGRIARATAKEGQVKRRTFGVQIDTVCDMVSFGVAPGLLAYALGFNDVFDIIIYIVFACFGAIRLAYFNTQALTEAEDMKMTSFTGMPIPTICFFIPPLALITTFLDADITHWIFKAVYIIVGFAFVGNFKMKKPNALLQVIFFVAMLACVVALFCLGDMKV